MFYSHGIAGVSKSLVIANNIDLVLRSREISSIPSQIDSSPTDPHILVHRTRLLILEAVEYIGESLRENSTPEHLT